MEMSFIAIKLKKKEEDSKMLNKAIKSMSVEEIESLLEQKKQEEAHEKEYREKIDVLVNELNVAIKECDAAHASLKECQKHDLQNKENMKHVRETWRNRRDIVSQKQSEIREISRNVTESVRERSEGFGERSPETVVLDTIRSIGEPVTVSRLSKRILNEGLYKGKSTSSYLATSRTVKSLLEKGQVQPVETDGDKREKKFASV